MLEDPKLVRTTDEEILRTFFKCVTATYIYIYIYICIYVYIYIYMYIYCDEETRHPHTFARLWGKEVRHAGRQPTIAVTKNWQWKERPSLFKPTI